MTSWIQTTRRKPMRLGYFQETPEGKFSSTPRNATVVTAYYEMPSKYDTKSYKEWIPLFMKHCQSNMVIFTEENLVPFFEECREGLEEKTDIIVLPRSEWVATKKFSKTFWESQSILDPEKNTHKSSDLYKVWYEKKEFVMRAIEKNPFDSEVFVWADVGICRQKAFAPLLSEFPHTERIPLDKIMIYNIGRYTERDEQFYTINGVTIQGGEGNKKRISAGIIAGSIQAWKQYSVSYDEVFDRYENANLFVGKEQNIMSTLCLEYRTMVSLVEPNPVAPEEWFYFALYLGCPKKVFEYISTKKGVGTKVTYQELLDVMKK
jgi:hypothetical protein